MTVKEFKDKINNFPEKYDDWILVYDRNGLITELVDEELWLDERKGKIFIDLGDKMF